MSDSEEEDEGAFGPHVDSAMGDASVELDERGLMALDHARALVGAATVFDKGEGRDIDGNHVLDSDLLWAALLSLEDAGEFCAAASRLAWRHMPRGRDNTAPVERYGAGVLPWLASRVRDGVLINAPWCVGPCLLAIGDEAALALACRLRGYRDTVDMSAWTVTSSGEEPGDSDAEAAAAAALTSTWISAHRDVALPWLAGAAARGDVGAIARLAGLAERGGAAFLHMLAGHVGADPAEALFARHGWPRSLTPAAILGVLDAATARSWPEFNYAFDGRQEYFALRLIGVRERTGDGWGVVLERAGGSYPDALWVNRFCFGSSLDPEAELDGNVSCELEIEDPEGHLFHGGVIRGSGGELRLDESLIDRWDLRPGKCTEVGYHPMRALAIRTYLAHAPGALWPDVDESITLLELEDPEVIVVTDAFAHVIGPYQREGVPEGDWQIAPSESPAFRSLADALVHRDPRRFVAGEPNTDWRRHAYVDQPVALPWVYARVDAATLGERGHLRAAMLEAGVDLDDRGLVPLADARARVAAATEFVKGAGRAVGDRWVQDSDLLWAALMSLGDGDELAAAMARLRWSQPPRGAETLAPVERYGEGALAWMRAMARDRVLTLQPPQLRANLLALASPGVVDLLLELEGVAGESDEPPAAQLAALRTAYLAAHPAVAAARLAERAGESPAARALLRQWALLEEDATRVLTEALGAERAAAALAAAGVSRELSADHVLARLDHHAARPPDDLAAWPRFVHGTGPADEYHALRLVAGRRDAEWAVILERVTGYGHRAAVRRFVYGRGAGAPGRRASLDLPIALPGTAPPVDGAEALCEAPDYWTGPDGARTQIAALRAELAARPAAFFVDPAILLAAVGLPGAAVIVVTTAFDHPVGLELPSASVAYRTLAAAIATGASFDPGEPSTDWRSHVAPPEEESGEDDDADGEDE